MTEPTRTVPDNAPALDLGRRVFARQARAESRLSPWTRRDLAGKAIVRELRFAQHIARRVYGRGVPGAPFEGQLSPNAPRGVARFSEKVAERNSLADVARKYAPADDAEAGDAAPKAASHAPMPLAGAGGGETSSPRNSGPAISAAEALQRLAVSRPDLDPDSSPFAKIFKAATGGAQPAEPSAQRAPSDSARRVVETFQRGGPRPRADAAPPPIQPRPDRSAPPIQRRADPSAPAAPVPPPATPAPERPPATPSSRALRRFARVEEVVPPNFTPPSDDFGDDLPEPGGPVIQRALPPVPDDAMPLVRRPEAAPTPLPATQVQTKRPAQPAAPAPKRPARPAPAPARLQRRSATPPARAERVVEPPARLPGPAVVAREESAARPVDAPSERETTRPSPVVQRQPASGSTAPQPSEDRPPASPRPTPAGTGLPLQERPAAEPTVTPPPPGDAGAPARPPIQRDTTGASSGDLPLARSARPEAAPDEVARRTPAAGEAGAPLNDASRPRPVAGERAEDSSRGETAPRKPVGPSTRSPARDASSDTLPPAQIQRAPSEGQTADLPIARPGTPPVDPRTAAGPGPAPAPLEPPQRAPSQRQIADAPPGPVQRQPHLDPAEDLLRARPSESPASPIQRQPLETQADDLPLAQPFEAPAAPPASPIQRQTSEAQTADLPLARTPEPPAARPASPIQRRSIPDAPTDLPPVRPPETPATPPAAPIQRPPAENRGVDAPRIRAQEPESAPGEPPPALIQRQFDDGQSLDLPLARTPESPPAAPIQRQPRDGSAGDLPLARTPTPEAPQPADSAPRIQAQPEARPAPAPGEAEAAPVKPPAIRPRPSALNLARRAVQRMLGEGSPPQPPAVPVPERPEQARPEEGDSTPRSGPSQAATTQGVRPRPDFELRRAPPAPDSPGEPGAAAPAGPTTWAESKPGASRATPMPARIQRAPAPMLAVARAGRGGEPIAAGPEPDDMRGRFDRGGSLPLVVPHLAAQSQSASRQVQRAETTGPSGDSPTGSGPQTAPRRNSASRPTGYSSEPAPKVGLKPKPDQPAPAKGSEPDLNYDLLAQRVYPFIRRLLAFERERERGS